METLRYFGGDEWVGNRFADAAEETRAAWTTWSLRRITFAGVFGGALAIQFIVAFAILLPRYQAGEITIGDLVLLGALLMQLNRPFEMIGNSIDGLLRSYSQFQPFTFMWHGAGGVRRRWRATWMSRWARIEYRRRRLRLRRQDTWSRTSASSPSAAG